MPIYEYGCYDCKKRVSIFWRTISAAETGTAKCPRCEGSNITRLISRVASIRSEESRLDALASPENMADLDENDPRSLAKFMRQMGNEAGEDLGPEFTEVVDRLAAGESPDAIEKDMPDLGGMGAGSSGGDDWFG